MESYLYIPQRLARFLARVPPEMLGAVLLLLIMHPGVTVWILGLIVSGVITGYLKEFFEIHIWPEVPPGHQRRLLRMKSRALQKGPDQDQSDARGKESAFSRHSRRHPHW